MPLDGKLPDIDTSVAHPARRYNYWLGGKDNFAADRESGDAIAAAFPGMVIAARENRKFLRRAVRFLAADAGLRQFLDVGTGIPTTPNLHEVAQDVDPSARVVYVDNDPIVLAHANALLTGTDQGVTTYVDADVRDPARILAEARETLDFDRPIGLTLLAIMHFVPDADGAHTHVAELVDALPPGSYLALTHATGDFIPPEVVAEMAKRDARSKSPVVDRDRAAFARFFDGLELVEPGIVTVARWREDTEDGDRPADETVSLYGAVARKP
ncbi:SAM-dependent methyltransferase [Cryptosporangium arvum]|uniref:S-adenosyl methyltransferase n=1 Tax=Cryptosporangium arvum DSM 44712 TaxID=927661 RepID=A0A010YR39_9ACTN|nr:SAM-dependent methyltransferase [Cryptosporangium arvum]EXG82660.1 Protein of unknown function (DUF574) [Cryptosporangium arvum DSM 44712]